MSSDNLFTRIRPIAAAMACASLPLSILGWPGLSKLEYVLIPALLGGLISMIYLKALVHRSWTFYIFATVSTLWVVLSCVGIMTVIQEPLTGSDIFSIAILAGIGTLAFFRQVILAIAIFVVMDLALMRLRKRKDSTSR